jgi:hypothetical protein
VKPEKPLPPKVPETIQELDEASALLGAYLQVISQPNSPNSKMKASRLARLKDLVGDLPSAELGRQWKSALKELRGELAECEKRAANS